MSTPLPQTDLDVILESFAEACRRGDRPEVSTWIERFPAHAEKLQHLLPAIRSLEPTSGGSNTRGEPMRPPPRPLPERLGEYRILHEIGRGGMGIVFEAIEEPLGRRVALKVLPALGLASPPERTRFQREAELASRLDHPGICTVFRAGVEDATAYIAMRLVEGETLAHRIARSQTAGRLPRTRVEIAEILGLVSGVARALQHAHDNGIAHRDIKPQNIMLDPGGVPVILDFGLARTVDAGHDLTRTGGVCGTPAYLAPEALKSGASRAGASADIWSLGVVLYEALTLQRPFLADSVERLYHAVLHEPAKDPRGLNPNLPRDLSSVVAAVLEKEPAHRYPTARALADDLESLIENRPVAVRPVSPIGRTLRWARREPVRASLLLGMLASGALLIGVLVWLSTKSSTLRRGEDAAARERVESELESGFAGLGEGGESESLRAFSSALETDPGCVEALAGLALTHVANFDFESALAVLDRERKSPANSAPIGVVRALILRHLGREQEAGVNESVAAAPGTAPTWFIRGLCELHGGYAGDRQAFVRALDHLKQAVHLSPVQRPFYLGALVNAATHCGDSALALEWSSDLLTLRGTSAWAWYWRAFALKPVDAKGAEAACLKALEFDGADFRSMELLGGILAERGDYAGAIEQYRKVVALKPGSPTALNNLASGLMYNGACEDALPIFREALRIAPRLVPVRRGLARAQSGMNDDESALETLREAVKLAPHDAQVWMDLGHIHQRWKRYDEAAESFSRAVRYDPRVRDGQLCLANCLYRLQRHAEALIPVEKAIAESPKAVATYTLKAAVLLGLGRLREAIVAARHAFQMAPQESDTQVNLERLLEIAGRIDEILDLRRGLCETSPSNPALAAAHGSALLSLNRFEEAASEFRRSLALKEGNPSASVGLSEALKELGRFDEGIEALQRGVAHDPEAKSTDSFRPRMDALVSLKKFKDLLQHSDGSEPPSFDSRRLVNMAWVALVTGEVRLARRLYAAIEAEFPDSLSEYVGYHGALAGITPAGPAAESDSRDEESRPRKAAHHWFREHFDQERPSSGTEIAPQARKKWLRWLHDPRLAPVRAADQLATLPAAERRAWTLLWDDLRRFLAADS